MREAAVSLIDFGTIVATSLASATRQVVATIRGNQGETDEEQPNQALWGHAAILARPTAPDSNGGECEVIFVRRGDELVPLASRDLRWQVDLSEGDVIVRSLSNSGSRIRLQADGKVIVEGDTVYVGDSTATEAIALGTALKNHLTSVKTWMDTHTHILTISAQAGAGGTGTAAPPSGASPSVPDIESRHKVEN